MEKPLLMNDLSAVTLVLLRLMPSACSRVCAHPQITHNLSNANWLHTGLCSNGSSLPTQWWSWNFFTFVSSDRKCLLGNLGRSAGHGSIRENHSKGAFGIANRRRPFALLSRKSFGNSHLSATCHLI